MNKKVIEILNETRDYLIKEISALSFEEFNQKPDPDSWSIAQVCHHLYLTEKVTTKVMASELKSENRNKAERKRVDLLLNRSIKIKAPKMVEPNIEPFRVQEIQTLLNQSRNKLKALLSTIEEESILAEKTIKHPFFGELSLDQWIELIYLHEQRHTEQIIEIKNLIDVKQ